MTSERLDERDPPVDPPEHATDEHPKDAVLVWNGKVASVRVRVRTTDNVSGTRPADVDDTLGT
ncbi:MAG: hypothetical protein WD015_02335 [Gaiellaceae bacterium]